MRLKAMIDQLCAGVEDAALHKGLAMAAPKAALLWGLSLPQCFGLL